MSPHPPVDRSQPQTDDSPRPPKTLPECKVKRNYSCNSCDFFTQNPRRFLHHLRDVHEERVRIYECPSCLYASRHFQKLLRHTRMVHHQNAAARPSSTSASNASKSVESPEDVGHAVEDERDEEEDAVVARDDDDDDEEEEDNRPTFKCSVCAFVARTRALLSRHERQEHIKTRFFRCTKCTYVTHMKARFTKHVKYHSMPMIKCDMCDFRTPYKWNLDRHCKNHNGRGAFRCSACNFTADIKQSLTVHEMNHHVPPVGQAAGLGVGRRRNKVGASDATAAEDAARTQEQTTSNSDSPSSAPPPPQPKSEQCKRACGTVITSTTCSVTGNSSSTSDFIHPDDIIHHANGNVYIKTKCKLCPFKTAWPGEMTKHERKVHPETSPKVPKATRPIPNLIPLPQLRPAKRSSSSSGEPEEMSQQDINDICAKSANSSLKDFASLFGSEDVFKDPQSRAHDEFKHKNASFFDRLKERLETGGGASNLNCRFCGHESKCLTEQVRHQKQCGHRLSSVSARTPTPTSISSSRCQYCRQRCKSSNDLLNHLQTCAEALKALEVPEVKREQPEKEEDEFSGKPHPMENRVFVWNNIEVPMDVQVDDSKYEYLDDDRIEDNVSLDLSVRTQSPHGSDTSYLSQDHSTATPIPQHLNAAANVTVVHSAAPTPSPSDKIPTHGTDISIAQHKRVFKCPHCSFWASTASRFHVHIVGHLNKKPFECSLCAYRSNWRWDITKHIKLKSVRDPAHESAKVLMTDETGRRNYTKYNKYLTEIHVSGERSLDTSGGSGTRHNRNHGSPAKSADLLPKLTRAPDFGPLLKGGALRPPPPLKAAEGSFFKSQKGRGADNKRTLFKCKKCNFRDASREILLAHVKAHYPPSPQPSGSGLSTPNPPQDHHNGHGAAGQFAAASSGAFSGGSATASSEGFASGRDDDERHCRLKHNGDIRVVSRKNGQERLEIDEQTDEPDHVDVPQEGAFKCDSCPYSGDSHPDFKAHLPHHVATPQSVIKCHYCSYFVDHKEDLLHHLPLHGVADPEDFLAKMLSNPNSSSVAEGDLAKRFKCLICPYVTNSKSQYTYHKQFHKPQKGGQYNCSECTYNVSKRHLLHQHLKVHGINVTPQKQNGEVIDLDEISDEIEEISGGGGGGGNNNNNEAAQNFSDIPLVWVSRNGKFSKMFKCRFCPHVNLRKVNIQEHEKMHGVREKNPNASSRSSDVEHHCTDCNYVCNNAGVLSSHSKVHQGLYGTVHCLVDQVKSDEEQIRELSRFITPAPQSSNSAVQAAEEDDDDQDEFENSAEAFNIDNDSDGTVNALFFCGECPARFLKSNEYDIHVKLHGIRLFYKCPFCTYSARQKPHLLAHENVHTTEFQERTKFLQSTYPSGNSPPETNPRKIDNKIVWLVEEHGGEDTDLEDLIHKNFTITRSVVNVPISGTDLFQQKSEAQKQIIMNNNNNNNNNGDTADKRAEKEQLRTLSQGNPNFVYPTYLKNGRMKEKRYKCHKCPSAFEKREQYKVHLNLHGSKQRYCCEDCDYSVKYYANYVQHLKKHKMNSDAKAAKEENDEDDEEKMEEEPTAPAEGRLSVGDQQSLNILHQRLVNSTSPGSVSKEVEDKKMYTCVSCPYSNSRRDSLDNHQRRHISLSGNKSNYTCDHCDYSVPQAHFLKEHTKLHFVTTAQKQAEGFMVCDGLTLVATKEDRKEVIFEEKNGDRFNNNQGEKLYVNGKTGEVTQKVPQDDAAAPTTKTGDNGDDKMDES